MKYFHSHDHSPGQRYSKLRMSSKIVGIYFSLIKQITENLRCLSRFHFIHFHCKCLNIPVVNRN